jgi:hypothetical protein
MAVAVIRTPRLFKISMAFKPSSVQGILTCTRSSIFSRIASASRRICSTLGAVTCTWRDRSGPIIPRIFRK